MYSSKPISITPDELWVFLDFGDAVAACRVAVTVKGSFLALPPEQFLCEAILPISRITGEPVDGLSWAHINDVAAYPNLFPVE
jgi:hypothetical protein